MGTPTNLTSESISLFSVTGSGNDSLCNSTIVTDNINDNLNRYSKNVTLDVTHNNYISNLTDGIKIDSTISWEHEILWYNEINQVKDFEWSMAEK